MWKALIVKRQQKRRRAIAAKFSIYYRCFFFLHNEAKKYLWIYFFIQQFLISRKVISFCQSELSTLLTFKMAVTTHKEVIIHNTLKIKFYFYLFFSGAALEQIKVSLRFCLLISWKFRDLTFLLYCIFYIGKVFWRKTKIKLQKFSLLTIVVLKSILNQRDCITIENTPLPFQ